MAEETLLNKVNEILVEWAVEQGEAMQASLTRHQHVDTAGAGSLWQYAGVTPDAIQHESDFVFRIEITLPDYYHYLNKGRGETRSTAPSTPTLRQSLGGANGWLARSVKGVRLMQSFMAQHKISDPKKANRILAFWVARKIHSKGYSASHWFDEVWGDDPLPSNSPPVKELGKRLSKVISDAKLIVYMIDPNKPD
jgi:hypothetical protein